MTETSGEKHVTRCLELLEEQLGWGNSEHWTNYDFSKLSDEVHQRTQVRLSVTTLKRVWGRLKYESAPALTTLNALAQFAGYSDWRDFCKQHSGHVTEPAVSIAPSTSPTKISRYWAYAALFLIVPLAWFLISFTRKPAIDPENFEFKANKMVAEGVPNSVVFHYDATAAASDSVYIVQTWDIRRKTRVAKNKHEHSAIYYYPGFFRTKLIADDIVVRTHDLFVTSNGWLALVEQPPLPIYFKKEEVVFGDRIEVDRALLKAYNLDLHPNPPLVRFFNQGDLGDIMSDNFVFETKLKAPFNTGSGACQAVQVLIQCKDDIIIIPIAAKACIGDLNLVFCGENVQSKTADLSGFGSDLNQWTTLRVEAVNKQVTFIVNGVRAYHLTFPNDPTGVVGLQYRFNGMGAVKETWFRYGDRTIPM